MLKYRHPWSNIDFQARSQPARWGGGLNLDGWNTRRTPPPLDIVRVTSSIWKTPPLLDIHKHPPLDNARVTSSTYSKGGTKLLKGGTKLLKGGTKLLKGGTKLLKGGTKLLKGGTKLLKGGTKLLKGGTKLLKGGTKSLGWATGGGSYDPPDPPPPGYGPDFVIYFVTSCWGRVLWGLTSKTSLYSNCTPPPKKKIVRVLTLCRDDAEVSHVDFLNSVFSRVRPWHLLFCVVLPRFFGWVLLNVLG